MVWQTWRFPERHPAGPGPWDDEPDKAQWVDPTTGLDCLIVRNKMASLCGYVGVPVDHPLHGLSHHDDRVHKLRAHQGVDYAAYCSGAEDGPDVCHVALPGRPEHPWWLGFSTTYHNDLQPRPQVVSPELTRVLEALLPPVLRSNWTDGSDTTYQTYRDFAYVRNQVTCLALQVFLRQ